MTYAEENRLDEVLNDAFACRIAWRSSGRSLRQILDSMKAKGVFDDGADVEKLWPILDKLMSETRSLQEISVVAQALHAGQPDAFRQCVTGMLHVLSGVLETMWTDSDAAHVDRMLLVVRQQLLYDLEVESYIDLLTLDLAIDSLRNVITCSRLAQGAQGSAPATAQIGVLIEASREEKRLFLQTLSDLRARLGQPSRQSPMHVGKGEDDATQDCPHAQ